MLQFLGISEARSSEKYCFGNSLTVCTKSHGVKRSFASRFCLGIPGSTYKSYLHKISILQNKAVKIVTPTKWNSSANPSYTNLKVLKLNNIYHCKFGKIMYNLYHKQHPHNLTNTSQSPMSDIPALPAVPFLSCLLPVYEKYKATTTFLISGS